MTKEMTEKAVTEETQSNADCSCPLCMVKCPECGSTDVKLNFELGEIRISRNGDKVRLTCDVPTDPSSGESRDLPYHCERCGCGTSPNTQLIIFNVLTKMGLQINEVAFEYREVDDFRIAMEGLV